MKRYLLPIVILIFSHASATAESQSERLLSWYENRGDIVLHALFSLPETTEAVRTRVPETEKWIPFSSDQWKELTSEEKISIVRDLGKEWEDLESDELTRRWERLRTWVAVSSQLDMVAGCADGIEIFFEVVYHDPLTKPAFDAAIENRPDNFEPSRIAANLASGEMIELQSDLNLRLMAESEATRYRFYSRLLAQLAARIEHES